MIPPLSVLFSSSQAKDRVGVDIGSHSIKVVELVKKDAGFSITRFVEKVIPRAEGEPPESTLSDLLRSAVAESGIRNKCIYLSVAGSNVVIRQTTVPKIPEAELTEAVKWGAREDLLFPIEEATVGWYVIQETEEDGAPMLQLLTVIAHQDAIERLMRIARGAGLHVLGITVVPLALNGCDQEVHPDKQGEVTAYVDMGADRTRVYIFAGKSLRFSREIPNGGDNLTEGLIGDFPTSDGVVELDREAAEAIKRRYGLPEENDEGFTEEGIPLKEIRERILVPIGKQVEELYRSLDYFRNQFKEYTVERLVLSGGGSGLNGMGEYMAQQISMVPERSNILYHGAEAVPGTSLDDLDRVGPCLTTAAGLALGCCSLINVLPEKYRFSWAKLGRALAPFAAIPVAAAIMIFAGMHVRGQVAARTAELEARNTRLAKLQVEAREAKIPMDKLVELEKKRMELERELARLPRADMAGEAIPGILDEFARAVPENVSLSRVAFRIPQKAAEPATVKKTEPPPGADASAPPPAPPPPAQSAKPEPPKSQLILEVEGNSFGSEQEALDALTRFVESLKRSPFFTEVLVKKSDDVGAENYTHAGLEFELTIRLGSPVPAKL